jgi:YD repeat-containing protein
MNRSLLLLGMLYFHTIFTGEPTPPPLSIPTGGWLTSLDIEPSGWIDGSVNVITGEFIDHKVDLTISGPKPLLVERTLIGNNPGPATERTNPHWYFAEGGNISMYEYVEDSKRCCVNFLGPSGDSTSFQIYKPKKKNTPRETLTWPDLLKKGITNTSSGVIGACTNIRHHKIYWDKKRMELRAPNGVKRHVEKIESFNYQVRWEIHPDRLRHSFEHTKKNQVITHNLRTTKKILASYTWNKTEKYYDLCKANDGRSVKYSYHYQPWEGPIDITDREPDEIPYWKKNYLTKVRSPEAPEVNYEYYPGTIYTLPKPNGQLGPVETVWEHPKLKRKIYPYGRILELHYYWMGTNFIDGNSFHVDLNSPLLSRISYLRAPLGLSSELQVKYQFIYSLPQGKDGGGVTTVYDALHHRTDYHFNERKRLERIKKFEENGALYSEEWLHWGPNNTAQEIELKGRSFRAADDPGFIFHKKYDYDGAGNILQETLYGNLTGRSPSKFHLDGNLFAIGETESFSRYYQYSGEPFYLLTQAKEGEIIRYFSYLPGTNLLSSELHANNERIYLRHFYEYDDTGLVVESIIDDGAAYEKNNLSQVTERKIQRTIRSNSFPFGLPLSVVDFYYDPISCQEKQLGEEKNLFDSQGHLLHKARYDSQGQLLTEESWSYDGHGNCLLYIDPLGQSSTYTYDLNDNKESEQLPGAARKKFIYDYMNRLIACFEEHPDGTLATHTHYDFVGNPVLKIDALGHQTKIEYDPFNRPRQTLSPALAQEGGTLIQPKTCYVFDPLSHPIKVIDPLGRTTEFAYTLLGKPYQILYPDGSKESYLYDLQGRLTEEIDKGEARTVYERDFLGRVTRKQIFSPSGELLIETTAGYNTFHLLWETDPEGVVTTFTYDASGRKISESKGDITSTSPLLYQ